MKNKNKAYLYIIGFIIAFAILIPASLVFIKVIKKDMALKEPYLYINQNTVTVQEYDYYFYSYYNSYIYEYSFLFSYMDIDESQDIMPQKYDENRTYEQYFNDCAVDQIIKITALYNDGQKNNFTFDVDTEYNNFISLIEESCNNSNNKIDDYFRYFYGQYATKKNTEPLLKKGFYASAYYDYLCDSMNESSDDDKAFIYTQDLKNNYEITYP